MKYLIVALMTMMAWGAFAASKDVCSYDAGGAALAGGDSNPWPWGRESRFPWLAIEGVWVPMEGDCNSLFVFKARNVQGQNRAIQIVQYDPKTCQKISWGAGVESDQVVHAHMVDRNGKSFDLTIRAFDETSVQGMLSPSAPLLSSRNVVVLSMYPKADWERRTSYQMQKVTDVPVMLCDSKQPVF